MEPIIVLAAAAILGTVGWRQRRTIREEWQAAKLRTEIRMGRKTWGRQPGDHSPGGQITVEMPVEATIEAVLIEAGTGRRLHPYTREPLADDEKVLLVREQATIPREQYEELVAPRPHRWTRRG